MWRGIKDSTTDVCPVGQTVPTKLENGSLLVKQEFQRRPGIGAKITNAGLACAEVGSRVVFVKDNGNIESESQWLNPLSLVLLTGYNVAASGIGTVRPCTAQAFQRLYIANDFDLMQVSDDGLTMRKVGIDAPDVVPTVAAVAGGSVGVGTHLVRYRYQDQSRSRLSDPSDAVSITVTAGNQTVNVTPTASADANVSHIIVEMTPAGQGTYFRAAIIPNASTLTAITMDDTSLEDQTPSEDDGDFQHQPPPLCSIIVEHRGRLWTWGSLARQFPSCTVTNGSPTVTAPIGAAYPFSPNWAGRQMVGPDGATYAIASSTATTITLATNYAGANNVGTITVRSGTPAMLGWSRATFPESFDPQAFARLITLDSGDTPSAAFSYYTDLYLCGTRSMRRLVFTGDPAAGMLLAVPGTMGAYHQHCVCTAGPGLAFGWGRDGMWMINAMQPIRISVDIEITIAALADPNVSTDARFVVYDPVAREVLFFFDATGYSGSVAAAYLTDTGEWQLWRYRQKMRCGCPNSAYQDRQRLMLSDSNGYSWRSGVTPNDGEGAGIVTVLPGTTSSVIQGVTSAQVGQMAYRPATGEVRNITAASPSQITLGAPFATTPALGELIYVGSIAQSITTGWVVGRGIDRKERPTWLLISYRAQPSGLMGQGRVQYFKNFDDSTPLQVTSQPSDEWPKGVYVVNGDTGITIDFDAAGTGFIAVPVPDTWERSIRAVITADQPQSGVRFLDVTFVNDDHLAEAPARNE